MATNPPKGDGRRQGAVRDRAQVYNPKTDVWTKMGPDGKFMDGKKTEGWIKRSDVCLAREAIDYFNEQIAAHPNDDQAYLSRAAAREELAALPSTAAKSLKRRRNWTFCSAS